MSYLGKFSGNWRRKRDPRKTLRLDLAAVRREAQERALADGVDLDVDARIAQALQGNKLDDDVKLRAAVALLRENGGG